MSNAASEEARKRAREAMEDPERRSARERREAAAAEQHRSAALSMESPEQRERRLAHEHALAAQAAKEKASAEAKARASELEKLRKEEEARLAETALETKHKAEEAQRAEVERSQETIAQIKNKPSTLGSLRTFKSDAEHALARATQASVALENEKVRRSAVGATVTTRSSLPRILLILLSLLLVGAGIAALGYALFVLPQTPTVTVSPSAGLPPPLIPVEETRTIALAAQDSRELRNELAALVSSSATSTRLIRTAVTQQSEGGAVTLTPLTELMRRLGWQVPDQLSRTLRNDYLLGVRGGTSSFGFAIISFRTTSNAIAGMLDWEERLPQELLPIVTGSVQEAPARVRFTDTVVRNVDARVLRTESGSTILAYAVLDPRGVIVITRNEELLADLIARLTAPTSGQL